MKTIDEILPTNKVLTARTITSRKTHEDAEITKYYALIDKSPKLKSYH